MLAVSTCERRKGFGEVRLSRTYLIWLKTSRSPLSVSSLSL